MNENERVVQDYYNLLVENAEKCEVYNLKLINDPRIYTAIPMVPLKLQEDHTLRFAFRILQPESFEGLYERNIEDIEYLEKMVI
jgi:hypothetical protein